MAAPFLYPGNMTSMLEFIQYANQVITIGGQGLIGLGILIVIGVTSVLIANGLTYKTMAFSGFMVLISAIFLRFLELVSNEIMYISIIIVTITTIILFAERNREAGG